MKKIIILLLFSVFFIPAFANEGEDAPFDDDFIENEENKDEKTPEEFEEKTYKKVYRAQVSPKREQLKTKVSAEKNLKKQKAQFQKRVDNELMLLNKEYDILEYR